METLDNGRGNCRRPCQSKGDFFLPKAAKEKERKKRAQRLLCSNHYDDDDDDGGGGGGGVGGSGFGKRGLLLARFRRLLSY